MNRTGKKFEPESTGLRQRSQPELGRIEKTKLTPAALLHVSGPHGSRYYAAKPRRWLRCSSAAKLFPRDGHPEALQGPGPGSLQPTPGPWARWFRAALQRNRSQAGVRPRRNQSFRPHGGDQRPLRHGVGERLGQKSRVGFASGPTPRAPSPEFQSGTDPRGSPRLGPTAPAMIGGDSPRFSF